MPTIPQRTLRNEIASVLRRAEAGEIFTVTVNGRPVAELRPLADRESLTLGEIIRATPIDPSWEEELRVLRDGEVASPDGEA